MTQPLLALDGVVAHYGTVQVLTDVSLEIHPGEIVTLIGSNGAGKSTTLRTVNGFLAPSAGTVRMEGREISGLPPHEIARLGVGHCLEGRHMFPRMSVRENLEMGAYRHGAKAAVGPGLEQVYGMFPRLHERRDQAAGTLSGGEQQMCALGRALMAQPKLLMLDEPSMGLAPIVVAQLFESIKAVNQAGTTVLLVEQNAALALEIADRAYAIETGRIVLSGPADELMNNPAVRAAYLGEG